MLFKNSSFLYFFHILFLSLSDNKTFTNMKKLFIIALTMLSTVAVSAQEKKPAKWINNVKIEVNEALWNAM